MKYITLFLAISILMNLPCYGTVSSQALGKLEESLYGFTYDNENSNSRLDRLENSVYGKITKGSDTDRIAKLSKDLSADSIGKEIPPVEDTFAEYPDYLAEEEMQETSDVSYPVIDEMEKQLFNQIYSQDKIKDRLSRLEQKIFNKTYNEDLSTRTERLRAEIKPKTFMDNKVAQSSNYFYDDELVEPTSSFYHLDKYVSPNSFDYEAYNDRNNRIGKFMDSHSGQQKPVSMSTIEKKLFKNVYNNEDNTRRLARIENSMFGTEFSSDDEKTRIDRISSAYKAEKSAGKYDSNKFAQNMATAMQIGTILLMVLACIL